MAQYTVLAGKPDSGEINWKYIDDFPNFDEALDAYQRVTDYPYHRIEDEDGNLIHPWHK
jgi:hypothetical protein